MYTLTEASDMPDNTPPTRESQYRREIIQESQVLAQRIKALLGSGGKFAGRVGDITYSLDCYPDGMCEFEFSYNPDRTKNAFLQIRSNSIDGFFPGKDTDSSLSFFTDSQDSLLPLEGNISIALMNTGVVLSQIEAQQGVGAKSTVAETAHRIDETLAS